MLLIVNNCSPWHTNKVISCQGQSMKLKINHTDINSFLTLVETGSFTLAAEQMQCSRSHVSKQLSQLEQQLGVSLLVRTTRTQHLTAVGEDFYKKCKSAFINIEQAIEQAIESASALLWISDITANFITLIRIFIKSWHYFWITGWYPITRNHFFHS